jgi:hypothetical protein
VRVLLDRLWLLGAVALAGAVVLWMVGPRLHYPFPSLIDDWNAIASAPEQLREVARLGNPEVDRYRPGWIVWNALQWHTFGAPDNLVGPRVWEVARLVLLVAGVTALAAVLTASASDGWRRWVLVASVPVVTLTAPALAVDLARYGPMEPLLVGAMSLGAASTVLFVDRLLEPRLTAAAVAGGIAGLVVWAFGVLQKETSVCVLLLAPFLWPTLRAQRGRWSRTTRGRRAAIGIVTAGVVAPFVPMTIRLAGFQLEGERFYDEAAASAPLLDDLSAQLSNATEMLRTQLPLVLVLAAVGLLALTMVRTGVDWLSVGLLVVAFAFVVFAAETGIVATRYFLPSLVLVGLVVARAAASVGPNVAAATGVALVAAGLWQAHEGRGWVEWWVDGERDRETLVREAAARRAGGCRVDTIGLNVELVLALPVLMPFADDPPRDCDPGERFVVVIDAGAPGGETPADDPVLAACAPAQDPAWSSHIGKILRCTA